MDSIFDDNNLAQGKAWFKFEKVGDAVSGILIKKWSTEAKGDFKAQYAFSLKQDNGEVVNVGIRQSDYSTPRVEGMKIGDKAGFKFKEEVPAKKKGYAAFKVVTIYHVPVDLTPEERLAIESGEPVSDF